MVEEAAILELGRHLALLEVVEEVATLVVLLESHSASLLEEALLEVVAALLEETLLEVVAALLEEALEVGAALLEVAPSQHQQNLLEAVVVWASCLAV